MGTGDFLGIGNLGNPHELEERKWGHPLKTKIKILQPKPL